ncbi:hypothetical protein SAMN02745947_02775 [Rhodococcus rhodochrous J3]|jgi:hypothetical protein|uniref:Uncharacterized protein n=2 Tax=Rhodococcus rhodochrous TaxID=1829 RepID=A0AA46WYY5_RHORH|nr:MULTISPECIES: hypothetical protein [Rhodococcus]AYA25342.1 hypothetical protein C6369_013220 [Rhodococcus rhodochrous]MBF4478473.1 hypothetical protein [Rhodococcus rhodochrous]MCB8913001.1 hypothetical protein [Rhodococcus rhodochrous]MDC3725469.1 hypothetical protein [Rhodococcus sp. Rp3]TWH53156.1 hypothetical protein L612_000200004730 [Rhodococcus rhodochrous J38]
MNYLPDGEHRRQLIAALRASRLGVEELWLRYFALGGEVGRMEIEAYLNGLLPLSRLQHDLIAHAINERLDEIAPPRAPYAADLSDRDDDGDPGESRGAGTDSDR